MSTYKIIQHTISYEPRTILGGETNDLKKARDRARALIEDMKQRGVAGYIMVRNDKVRSVELVLMSDADVVAEAR